MEKNKRKGKERKEGARESTLHPPSRPETGDETGSDRRVNLFSFFFFSTLPLSWSAPVEESFKSGINVSCSRVSEARKKGRKEGR